MEHTVLGLNNIVIGWLLAVHCEFHGLSSSSWLLIRRTLIIFRATVLSILRQRRTSWLGLPPSSPSWGSYSLRMFRRSLTAFLEVQLFAEGRFANLCNHLEESSFNRWAGHKSYP